VLFSKASNAKIHIVRDQFEKVTQTILDDYLIGKKLGMKREVFA
jgi:hypothetical protein